MYLHAVSQTYLIKNLFLSFGYFIVSNMHRHVTNYKLHLSSVYFISTLLVQPLTKNSAAFAELPSRHEVNQRKKLLKLSMKFPVLHFPADSCARSLVIKLVSHGLSGLNNQGA